MEQEHSNAGEGQPTPNPTLGVGDARVPAGSPENATPVSPTGQRMLPEATQQMLQELIDLPGQILPPETVRHLKNAGRETLLAVYSLWQNMNRASTGASGEKVRKHIEVE